MVGHRNCSIVGCANSGAKLKKWIDKICEIHGCNQGRGHCICSPPFALYPFPTLQNIEERRKWIKAVNRKNEKGEKWEPNKDSRVCSAHFVDGKPTSDNPDPTLKLGYTSLVKQGKRRKPPSVRFLPDSPAPKVAKLETSQVHVEANDSTSVNLENPQSSLQPEVIQKCQNDDCEQHIYEMEDKVNKLEKLVAKHRREAQLWKQKFVRKQEKPFTHKSLNSDKKVKAFTGIPSRNAFNVVYRLLKDKVPKIKYWHGPSKLSREKKRHFKSTPKKSGPKRLLSSKDEFTLTLMKLRLGSTNADLAERFQISETTISKIFNTWVRFLSNEMKGLIYNPPKEVALQHLPKKFKSKYSNVRHIIDCSEVFIETPKDPVARSATWSEYKHHNTIKILISIMPCGTINFISEGWGGRTSDVVITQNSGFYDILERSDEVMADKGFNSISADLLTRHCRLHVPPGKRGHEQMKKQDVKKTKEIANLRIFVEQAIRRLKTFRILKNEMPITLLDKFDDIVIICAAICNLYPKLTA